MPEQSVLQKHFLIILGAFTMLLFTSYAFAITFWTPKVDPTIMGMILGILGTGGFGTVIAYFFGSSAGSAHKTDALSKIAEDKKS